VKKISLLIFFRNDALQQNFPSGKVALPTQIINPFNLVNLIESKWNDLISDFYRIKSIMSDLYGVNTIPCGG